MVFPGPAVRLDLYYDYLEEARNAILALTGKYLPDEEEQRGLGFKEDI